MLALALCLVGAETLGLAIEEKEGVSLEAAWSIRDKIARAIEQSTNARVRISDVDATHCATRDRCLTHVRAETGAAEVVLLRFFSGVTRMRVTAQLFGAALPPRAEVTADFPLDVQAWDPPSEALVARLLEGGPLALVTATSSVSPTSRATEPSRLASWILGGSSLALAGVGIAFGASSTDAKGSLEANIHSRDEYRRLETQMRNHALAANILIGTAGVALVTAIVLYFVE